ncbi:integral membrane protein [Streptomyces laurentii]|uniref:Integral membrane protein n=1 Tax=Streptomyces laurentii TaxID=39478 RepID=A0A169MZ63_STRLU|nr:integral membrane protein [Streptomyces laurentii]
MRTAGTHLAAVTGDNAAVVRFVTMEDVLEELVGEAAAPGA